MVGPDGDVYFGIYGNPANGSRGFMLHFSSDLSVEKAPGGFGWDNTASVVPASMVPSYNGPSSFLLFSKYNNYANAGNDSGDGVNRVALLDPNSTQVDAHASSNGMSIMREVLTVIGPTADPENRSASAPTRSANGASTLCIGHEFCCQQWKHHSVRSEHHCYNHCNYFFRESVGVRAVRRLYGDGHAHDGQHHTHGHGHLQGWRNDARHRKFGR